MSTGNQNTKNQSDALDNHPQRYVHHAPPYDLGGHVGWVCTDFSHCTYLFLYLYLSRIIDWGLRMQEGILQDRAQITTIK